MLLRNAFAKWITLFVNITTAMLATPIIIHYLGETVYGLWLLLMSVWAFMDLIDCGITLALTRRSAAEFAQGKSDEVLITAGSCFSLYMLASLVVLGIYLALALNPQAVFNIPQDLWGEFAICLVILGVAGALDLTGRLYESLLNACEKFNVVSKIEVTLYLMRLSLVLFLLIQGGGLLALSLVHLATVIGQQACLFWSVRRHVPLDRLVVPKWNMEPIKYVIVYSRDAVLSNIGRRAVYQGPSLMLGVMSIPAIVAQFGVAMRLISYVRLLVYHAVGVGHPRFAALEVAGNKEGMQELLENMTRYAVFLAGYLCMGVFLLGPIFIHLWVGPNFASSGQVVRIIAVPLGVYLAMSPCEVLLLAIGLHRYTGYLTLGEGMLILLSIYLVIPAQPLWVLALCIGASFVMFRPIFLPYYACRSIGLKLKRYWFACVAHASVAHGVALVLLFFLFQWWRINSWLELICAGLVLTLVDFALVWLVGLRKKEKEFWLEKYDEWRAKLTGNET
ncbi:MAG: hypothetical protein K9K66_13605 [Desulfarculaceae bacterium]|nr:hypothetical protein [Desulfarculaceae bacterium]MCF8074000.1 hypothetical protein [Desulfarculaceae bacterium]MCF8102686.1 hypothetical protein [Desulfarculaceae bacterium]MCF8116073.1 hypothetical protein [Desulfarculaceae bacterium]